MLTGLVVDVLMELVLHRADFSVEGEFSMSVDAGDGIFPFVVTVL